ncbi:uncharacterized protein SOCE26_050330 [Sorangium cellulosum]|uniref:Uncharacterized protein n=1 Tax=Sorangium cellulosum TaxID=56 RepID=A0A2L0EWA7_SORCE|nr:uncharacterized protein SOCE26_050330 [Sorangium cellulosum]
MSGALAVRTTDRWTRGGRCRATVVERRGVVHAAASPGGGTALEIKARISAPLVRRCFTITPPKETIGTTPVSSPRASFELVHSRSLPGCSSDHFDTVRE